MVYFIQCGAFVKIGYCDRDPIRRLEKLQVGNPIALTLLALIEGGKEIEREWHSRYDKMRVRGEWFRLTPAMIKTLMPHLVDHDQVSRMRPPRTICGFPAHRLKALVESGALTEGSSIGKSWQKAMTINAAA